MNGRLGPQNAGNLGGMQFVTCTCVYFVVVAIFLKYNGNGNVVSWE